jgi:catechol 2,3-dioxygenase-like lactoylglutathione lyase family enzyme
MPAAHDADPWTIRTTLIAVGDLERSVAFYQDVCGFEEVAREDAVAVLGGGSPRSAILILRESRSTHHIRHGQQSLGLRSITFNVGSKAELDRVESALRDRELLTSRQSMADGAAELVSGRDPDNQPLVFLYHGNELGPDYYQAVARMVYSLDT